MNCLPIFTLICFQIFNVLAGKILIILLAAVLKICENFVESNNLIFLNFSIFTDRKGRLCFYRYLSTGG